MTDRAPTSLDMPAVEDNPLAGDDQPIAPARPRDVLVLVDEPQTNAWLAWIRKGEASRAGLVAMAVRSLTGEEGARKRTGHGAKIEVAVAALEAQGKLPPHLRPCVWDQLVLKELERQGYKTDLPDRFALHRFRKLSR